MESATTTGTRARSAVGLPGLWWKLLCGLWTAGAILGAFLMVGPAVNRDGTPIFTMGGHGAKIIFFHVPCAWLATLAYIVGAIYAIKHLRAARGRVAMDSDLKCAAAMELGFLFAVLATVTGSIFSHNEWGAYWSWDPRQTSILVILLIFAAYIVLRGAIAEPEMRARLSSAYALVAVVPGLFLIWVLPRIVETLHSGPNKAVVGGGLSGNYRLVLYGLALPAFLMLFTWMFQLRVRALKLLERHANG